MERRKFIIGAGALATGSAAAVGTGAFSAAEADRAVEVDVVNDEAGLLGIEAGLDSDFVSGTGDGQLEIAVPDSPGAEGLNDDSRFQLGNFDSSETNYHEDIYGDWVVDDTDPTEEFAFAITNQDTTSHHITVEGDFGDTDYRGSHQAHVAFGLYYEPLNDGEYGGAQQEDAINSSGGGPSVTTDASDGDPQEVAPGDTVYVSILFDTNRPNVELSSGELDGSISIGAE